MPNQNEETIMDSVMSMFSDMSQDLSFVGFGDHFHFVRPAWLLAFIALFLVIYLLKRMRYYQSPWQHLLPKHLAHALLENADQPTNSSSLSTSKSSSKQANIWLKPFIIGSCIIIALAGPAWQKLPQPVYQLERGAVLVMDMTYSTYATDLKPNRLTRSRYKAIDLLDEVNEGDIGLIAYAGDAFIISPLTQDVKNIALLLPSLSPDIMPVQGSNALAALDLADQTLKNAGHVSGDIYWFTDDIDADEVADIYQWSSKNNHNLNILGIGTNEGAPIKLNDGQLLKDDRGAIVIPRLPEGRLSGITKRTSGVYRTITNDDSDIKALTAHLYNNLENESEELSPNQKQQSEQALQGDQYREQGPWLLLIILPLVLGYFRRGTNLLSIAWLLPLTFISGLLSYSPTTYANTSQAQQVAESDSSSSFWQNLWQTADQQGYDSYQAEDFSKAATQFENSQWQGSAHYKAGNFEQALEAYKQSDSATALYNQGNTLAQLQKVDEAIEAYKSALEKKPDFQDAKDNLAQLEALKEQQEQQQQNSDENSEQDSEQNSDQEQSDQDSQQNSDQESQENQESGEPQDSDNQEQSESSENEQQSEESTEQESAQDEEDTEEQEAKKAEQSEEEEEASAEEQALAEAALDKEAQETQQKHLQLMNKVTDDPYLLLRNKMRLEYKKRRYEGTTQGENKKW